jgi:PAS domain S-box-containing protein
VACRRRGTQPTRGAVRCLVTKNQRQTAVLVAIKAALEKAFRLTNGQASDQLVWMSGHRALPRLLSGAVLILTVTAALELARVVQNAGTLARQVQHIYLVIGSAEGLLSTLKDAETGQRGYLLTGDDTYLGPYEDALTQVRTQLSDFAQLLADSPAQESHASSVGSLVEKKVVELGLTVSLRHSGDVDGALAVVRSGEGKTLMDTLRAEIGAFNVEQRRLLAIAEAAYTAGDHAAKLRALFAAVLVLASGITMLVVLSRRGKRAELALAETARELSKQVSQLDAIYDSAPVGLSYCDRSLRYVTVNERLAAINGRSVAAHLGRTIREVQPEMADVVEPLYRRVLDTGEPVLDVDIRTTTAGASEGVRDYLAFYWPVYDVAGAVAGVNVAMLDITDRKAAETALAVSEARLRTVFETVPIGLITADLPSGRITGGNAYVHHVTGHPVLLSPNLNSYDEWVSYHPDGRRVAGHEYPIARIQLGSEEAPELEVLYDRQGSRRWTRIIGRPVRDKAGAIVGAVVAIVDTDDMRRAQLALAASNATLEAKVLARTVDLAAANAQLDAFAYTVSHDLRAPLRAMEGFARILLDDMAGESDDKGRRYAERIVGAAERMDGLINDLLAYSRLQRARPTLQIVDPERIAARAAEEATATSPDPGAVSILVHTLPLVRAEPVILGQILTNLIGNAVKFRREGVAIQVAVWAEETAGRVRITVEDNGIGIAPEHQLRIFKVFERLHGQETYPGTGIGLAIVQKGVERMGGSCGVESAPGAGSRFWIELDAADPPNRVIPDAGMETGKPGE